MKKYKYKKGGQWKPDNKATVDAYNPQGTSMSLPASTETLYPAKRLTTQEEAIQELKQAEASTTPIGYKPTWQDRVHIATKKAASVLPGAYSAIPEMMLYPADAIANLSQPSKYFAGKQREEGVLGGADVAMDISAALPVAQGAAKRLSKAVQNTYRINPWAFKPQEGMMYRGLGKEGYQDAINSRVFRPKQNTGPKSTGIVLDKTFDKTYYAPAKRFDVIENYGPDYVAEVPYNEADFNKRYGRTDWSYNTQRQIPIEEGRILKKNWLQGYKEVPINQYGGQINNQDMKGNKMKKGGMYIPKMMVGGYKGGPIGKHQWELPSSPGTPGYEEYGTMYYVPGGHGLYEKPRNLEREYAGYGNPANLLSNQVETPYNRPAGVSPFQKGKGNMGPNAYLQGEGDISDYSIEKVREQDSTMQHGGFMQKKGMFWDGQKMVRAKEGAYDTMFQNGGPTRKLSAPPPMSRREYVNNQYPSLMKRYQPWTKEDEDALDDRDMMFREIAGKEAYIKRNPIDPRTLKSIVPDKYSDYSELNKPQFENVGYIEPTTPIGGYRNGGFTKVPVEQHMDRYGLNLYQNGGMAKIPVKQEMGRYGLNLYQQGGSVPPMYTAFQPTLDGMYKDGGIHIKPENKGKFIAWAQSHEMGVQEAARHVMANKEDYSSTIVKRANFAKNAAGWKKQYGGPMYNDGGTVLPAANDPWGSTNTNTDTQMQEVYAPVQQANADATQVAANSYANRPRVTTDQLSGPTDSGTNPNYQVSPYAPNPINEQEEEDNTVMKQRRPFGTGYRNLLGAAMMYGQYAADKRQQKGMQAYNIQQGMTQMNPNPTPFSRGTYNQQGQMMKGKYGGHMQYRMGGVYEVDDSMLEGLKMGGYKFKMV